MTGARPADAPPTPARGSLLATWGPVFGAPFLWAIHFAATYLSLTVACDVGGTAAMSAAWWRVVLVAITIVLGGAAVAGGVIALRRWRAAREGSPWTRAVAEPESIDEFRWLLGVLLGFGFAAAIVLTGLLPTVLEPCPLSA
jgi:hypothetical protein